MDYNKFESDVAKLLEIDFKWSPRGIDAPCIYQQWCSGGLTGGSCWDTGDAVYRAIDGDTPPSTFEELDKIIAEYWADIPYMQYRKHFMDCFETTSNTSNDYYGNYTNYTVKYVTIRTLYDILKENGKI